MAEPHSETAEREKSRRIGALAALWPFMKPYRPLMIAALFALTLTATVSLILPMAVRRVVDGFGTEEAALLDQYFGAALAIAALLALGTGLRYYLVTRLGERVVADIRKAVFDKTIGMSPVFFERQQRHHALHLLCLRIQHVSHVREQTRAQLRAGAGETEAG